MAPGTPLSPTRSLELSQSQRRKIRKGTQSCWECKRRKVKCRFRAPQDSICTGCKERGTSCISQEFADTGRSLQIGERVDRIESLVDSIVQNMPVMRSSVGKSINGHETIGKVLVGREQRLLSPTPGLQVNCLQINSEPLPAADFVSQALTGSLPSQDQIELILRYSQNEAAPVQSPISDKPHYREVSECFHSTEISQHPLFPAKLSLMLSLHLQNLSQSTIDALQSQGIDCSLIENRGLRYFRNLARIDDETMQSREGIECLALESMYYNSAGNIHEAWFVLRRAITTAQLLGMNLTTSENPVSDTSLSDHDTLYFRLVQSDCYLSLVLGLPQADHWSGTTVSVDSLQDSAPIRRLQHLHCLVAGRMMRESWTRNNLTTLAELDSILQEATTTMPAEWWLAPEHPTREENYNRELSPDDSVRLVAHFAHFHLLAQLHLPYIFHGQAMDSQPDHTHIAMYACRELLIRHECLAKTVFSTYCRGIDILVLIACVIMCVIHITSGPRSAFGHPIHRFSCLAHQRIIDRGLMTRMVESLQKLDANSRKGNESTRHRILHALQCLLVYELQASQGHNFSVSIVAHQMGRTNLEMTGIEEGSLAFHIPWVGIVTIERIVDSNSTQMSTFQPPHQAWSADQSLSDLTRLVATTPPANDDDWMSNLLDCDAQL